MAQKQAGSIFFGHYRQNRTRHIAGFCGGVPGFERFLCATDDDKKEI